MGSVEINKDRHREFWVCGALLCAALLAYHALYFNSVLPVSACWSVYYAELLNRGQVPYRDFAYYLPPLNLPVDWIYWKLSFGNVLLDRGWFLLERILSAALLYKLMTKWFQPRYAWIACLMGTCLGAAAHFDLCGGSNQTEVLLSVLLAYPVSAFLEEDSEKSGAGELKNKCGYMFYSGILLAAMLLTKQSLGLAAGIVCFISLVICCITFRDKGFGRYCAAAAMGALIPLLACCVILMLNGAFFPFLEQFFGMASAKGGTGTILLSVLGGLDFDSLKLFCLCVLLALTGRTLLVRPGRYDKCVFFLVSLVLILSIHQSYSPEITAAAETLLDYTSLKIAYAVLVLLSVFFCVCGRFPPLERLVKWNYTLPAAFLFCAALACVVIDGESAFSEFYYRSSLFSALSSLLVLFSRYSVLAFGAYYILTYRSAKEHLFPKSVLALFACALIEIYTNSMSSAGAPILREAYVTAPVFAALLFSFRLPKWNSVKNYAACLLCVFVCALCMLQKYTGAYTWWGSEESWPLNERTEAVELDALAGFRLPAQMKLEFEQITRVIEENGNEDSTVWGFPHVKIFNVLTDHYNVDDPVPILFYDVSTDEMAGREVQWLRQSPPDFVIWCDIPDCIEVHEETFKNGGRLGHRDIVDWFAAAGPDNYVLVGQAGNLFLYQLRDSVPVHYTYIQDPEAKNTTIGEY